MSALPIGQQRKLVAASAFEIPCDRFPPDFILVAAPLAAQDPNRVSRVPPSVDLLHSVLAVSYAKVPFSSVLSRVCLCSLFIKINGGLRSLAVL